MKSYLSYLIKEQVNRAQVLKSLIAYPLEPVELYALAERCTSHIDHLIDDLNGLFGLLDEDADDETMRFLHRRFKSITRRIEWIEQYGISVLKLKCKDYNYLNKLITRIHHESKIPINIATVASFSNRYFFFASLTNVIFIPAAEHKFILHLPDLYHELGHYVSSKKEEIQLKNTRIAYQNCVTNITGHFKKIIEDRMYGSGPASLLNTTFAIHAQWKESWLEELFSDAFAAFLLGPAYAWSHIHLVTKTQDDVYYFDNFKFQEHPSDEARFRFICNCLGLVGYDEEVKSLKAKWNTLIFVKGNRGTESYYEAFPDTLFDIIATQIQEGLEADGFLVIGKTLSEKMPESSIANILNNAWNVFWKAPNDFFKHEEAKLQELGAPIETHVNAD